MSSRFVSKLKFTQSIKIMKVVLAYAFDPNNGAEQMALCEFNTSLVYED